MSDQVKNVAGAVGTIPDEVYWLAMQYVTGDLTEDEAEAFELAMADDVTLCEVVLLATRLSAGIVLARSVPHKSTAVVATVIESRKIQSRPPFARWSVFVATAAMVLAVITIVTMQNAVAPDDIVQADDAAANMLAMLLENSSSSEISVEYDELTEPDDFVSDLVAPEWLLTAVDLDSASTQEQRPAAGPNNESGVY